MSKIVWAIAIIVILVVLGFFIFRGGDDSSPTTQPTTQETTIDNAPNSAFPDLQTSDDVFNELDDTLNFVD